MLFGASSENIALRQKPLFRYYTIALALVAAELTFSFLGRTGIVLYFIIFWSLVWNSFKALGTLASKTYVCLTLVPLIRIFSVALPLSNLPILYWYILISIPLFLSAFSTAKLVRFSGFDPMSVGGSQPKQLAVGGLGVVLGWIGSHLPLGRPFTFVVESQQVWMSVIVLILCTGFLEELVFRGIIYQAVKKEMGAKHAIVLVSTFNSSLYLSNLSLNQFFYVFIAVLIISVVYEKQQSLLGVSLAHGLLNITLMLTSTVLLTSTVTAATWSVNVRNPALIDLVGEIVIFTLIFLLMCKEYLPHRFQSSTIEKQKAGFLIKLLNLTILPFLFVFSYTIVVHALKFLP